MEQNRERYQDKRKTFLIIRHLGFPPIFLYEADFRNGNLDPLSPPGKGFIGAQIVAKTNGTEDCNIKMNNFRFYVEFNSWRYHF